MPQSVRGLAEWGLRHPGIEKGVPAYDRDGTGWTLGPFRSDHSMIPGFLKLLTLCFWHALCLALSCL